MVQIMNDSKKLERPIDKAVRVIGGEGRGAKKRAADEIGIRPEYLHKMIRTGNVPPQQCKAIERAAGGEVTAEQLNPSVFGETS